MSSWIAELAVATYGYFQPSLDQPRGALGVIIWWETHRGLYNLALLLTVVVGAVPAAVSLRFAPSMIFALMQGMGIMMFMGMLTQRLRMPFLHTAFMSAWYWLRGVASRAGDTALMYVDLVVVMLLFVVLPANVWYTLGWIAELPVRAIAPDRFPQAGPILFRIGLLLSVGFIVTIFAGLCGRLVLWLLLSLPRPFSWVVHPVIYALFRAARFVGAALAPVVLPVMSAFFVVVGVMLGTRKRDRSATSV